MPYRPDERIALTPAGWRALGQEPPSPDEHPPIPEAARHTPWLVPDEEPDEPEYRLPVSRSAIPHAA